ncbi:MAG: ABC transporter permease [Bacteroidales bacterium]|nr:ABC transporter permease [Bacteroidales bacterium]MCF8457065.1 ABC transporter permease [Bacteroidales bacterium]
MKALITLIRIELFKIFRKGRTYIGFGAIFLIIFAIQAGIYFEGQNVFDFILQQLEQNFFFEGNLINGYLITYIVLNTLWIHVPILVALVTGDLIAGEANAGTFRLILTRPVSRVKLLIAKFLAGWTYTFLLVLFMAILGMGMGILIFGKGDLMVLKSTINFFPADELPWRFFAAFAYGMLSMTVVAALAFMLSAFSDNSIGPIIGAVAIIIGITIISTIGFSWMKTLNPYLFTSYLPGWQQFFEFDINKGKLIKSVLVQLSYLIAFLGVAIVYFRKKDILS